MIFVASELTVAWKGCDQRLTEILHVRAGRELLRKIGFGGVFHIVRLSEPQIVLQRRGPRLPARNPLDRSAAQAIHTAAIRAKRVPPRKRETAQRPVKQSQLITRFGFHNDGVEDFGRKCETL